MVTGEAHDSVSAKRTQGSEHVVFAASPITSNVGIYENIGVATQHNLRFRTRSDGLRP
jgi:hypothetical protein